MRSCIVGFIAGIGLLQTRATLWEPAWLALLALVALACLWCSRRPGWIALLLQLCAGFLLGFCWASAVASHALNDVLDPGLEGQDLVVVGVVDRLPNRAADGIRFNLQVESAVRDGRAVRVPEHVALGWYAERAGRGGADAADEANDKAPAFADVQPGERWQFSVRLQRPHGNANPEGFDYEVWLLEQGVRATGQVRAKLAAPAAAVAAKPRAARAASSASATVVNRRLNAFVPRFSTFVERWRAIIRDRILAALPGKPYAGAMVALVIGDQRAIPQSDWTIFNRTGIGHLVSISGLHITMIAGLFAGAMHFLWRRSFFTGLQLPLLLPAQKAAALTAAVTALLYVLLAGFGVPAQRTLYMIWVVAAALWCGRIDSVSHVLCLAAAVVVLLDPWAVLWPGFWLSFGAVAIILYASVGRGRARPAPGSARHLRWLASLREAVHTQYVVTLGLVPLTILLFGQVSLVAPLANAVAIPLVSLLVAPLALAGAFLPAPLCALLLGVAHALFYWLAALLTWMSGWAGAVWATPVPPFWMFGCALVGALWLLAPRGWPARWLGAACWLPLLYNSAVAPAAGNLSVTAFDVGQGMALLIETSHHRLLYDTGPFYSPGSDGANRVILPYLKARGIDRLDGVIVSHNDNDHSGGALSLFAALPVDWVASSLAADSPIVAAAPHHRRCVAGQHWSWDGIDFEMLHPGAASYESDKWKPNARGCTLKLTRGAQSMLLPADIEAI
jgi:competence protein ComEC